MYPLNQPKGDVSFIEIRNQLEMAGLVWIAVLIASANIIYTLGRTNHLNIDTQ